MVETTIGATRWDTLERWSPMMFLAAGILYLIVAIVSGVEVVTDMSLQGPLLTGIPWAVGLVIIYLGLLGVYPRLADRTPQLARTGLGLLLLPLVVVIGVLAHALVVGSEPPFADAIFMTIFVGFTLGVTLLGIASVRTRTPSRAVGLWLLAFAATWFVLLAVGTQNPVWVDSVIAGTRAVVVLAIGYLLRTESTSTDRAEPAPTEVRHG